MDWLFDSTGFVPFKQAENWSPEMRTVWVISNLSIAICFFVLALSLVLIWHKKRNTVTSWLVLSVFAAFLILLGLNNLMSIITLYWAPYRLLVALRALGAIVALVVAFKMPFIATDIIKLPSRQLMHDLNNRLNSEVLQKGLSELELKERNEQLANKLIEIETIVSQQQWFQQKNEVVSRLRELLLSCGGLKINGT